MFRSALDTSAVATSDLGDGGDGRADAFNVTVIAIDQAGHQALVPEIVRMGSGFTGSARVGLRSSAAPGHHAAQFPVTVPIIDTKFRYTPVTPLNSGDGMQAVLKYTISTSIKKETDVNSAVISTTPGGGGWSAGNMQLEEKDRDVTAPFTVNGSIHRWIWASYKYVEYAFRLDHEWKANHFTGKLTGNNPDSKKNSSQAIGVVTYKVPGFTPGPHGAYWFELTRARSGWTRSNGTRKENDANTTFFIPFGGNVGLHSLTTYAAVTSITYNYISGCSSGHKRVIWGWNDDPVDAPRIQANCFSNSRLG